jgi:hypothetical protein
MKFVCEFNMDNDAFMDYDEFDVVEVIRILQEIAREVGNGKNNSRISDSYGNNIGKWSIS